MAITKKIKQLVNPANSEEYIYPITGTAATYDSNGNSVDTLLLEKLSIAAVSNVPWTYSPNAAYTGNVIGRYSFCYIDEFRFSNKARWTSNFTPPTEPYA